MGGLFLIQHSAAAHIQGGKHALAAAGGIVQQRVAVIIAQIHPGQHRAIGPAVDHILPIVSVILGRGAVQVGQCAEAIGEAFLLACGQAGISSSAVREAATIDVKAHEEGLLAFCRARKIPLATYSAEELSQVEGSVSPSDFVRATVGVDNVCERAALAGGGKLIFPKLAHGGVTVAFSKVTIELSFKER